MSVRQQEYERRIAREMMEQEREKYEAEQILFNAERDVRRVIRRLVRSIGRIAAEDQQH